MPKLLVSIATLSSGGAERVLSVLSKTFADNFDEVTYITWLKAPMFYDIDARVKHVCLADISKANNRFCEILTFRKFVKLYSPDIVLSFLTSFNILVILALSGMKIPLVACERTDPDRGNCIFKLIRNIVYRKASGILTQTYASKNSFNRTLREKTSVIYNPVCIPPSTIGSALSCKKDKTIVTVGRLLPVKNQKMMIDAFAKVHSVYPEYKLVIYGEGPERNNLEIYSMERGLEDYVILPGNKKNVWNVIKAADVFLLTSKYEGMPNALLEAMCVGLPCISTEIKAAKELIVSGENGFVIKFDDVEGLSNIICELLKNKDKATTIGNNASAIYKILQEDVVSQQWISYLKSFIMKK